MKTGRPSKRERTPFETRLHAAREAAGLSQAQVAEKLGITQSAYAFWERRKVALRPEQIEQVAKILGVTAEHLFGASEVPRQGPTGKARQLFERVSKLPRATQQRILANVEDALTAHEVRRASLAARCERRGPYRSAAFVRLSCRTRRPRRGCTPPDGA